MQTFKPNDLQKTLGSVFNAVQADGEVLIDSRSRPDMVLMLKDEKDALIEKIRQLTELAKEFDLDEMIEIRAALRNK